MLDASTQRQLEIAEQTANENMRAHYSDASHVYRASEAKLDKQVKERLISLFLFPTFAVLNVFCLFVTVLWFNWWTAIAALCFWAAMVWHVLRVVRINSEWADHGRKGTKAEAS